jgi:hypothetical protein
MDCRAGRRAGESLSEAAMTKNDKGRDRWHGATPKTTGSRNLTASDPLVGLPRRGWQRGQR